MKAFATFSDPSNYTRTAESQKKSELNTSISIPSSQFGLNLDTVRSEVEDITHYDIIISSSSTNFVDTLLSSTTARQSFKNLTKIAHI